VWIFLWVLFSAFVMGAFLWSVRILFQQKMAWKKYAQKTGLTYNEQKGALNSPYLTGSLGAYGFGLFSEPQATNDSRGQRYVTVLEFILRKGLGTLGVIGTSKMVPFADNLQVTQAVNLSDKDWDATWFIRSNNAALTEKYMTPARIDIFKKIFRMKILGAMLIFDENESVLRIETSDPLNDADRVEKIVKGFMAHLPALVPET